MLHDRRSEHDVGDGQRLRERSARRRRRPAGRHHHRRQPQRRSPGRVDYIASLADPGTKAVPVRVVVPNTNHALRRDMFVRVQIKSSQEHRGILVPVVVGAARRSESAVRLRRRRPNKAFARRRIDLGTRVGDQYEVMAGLNAGDQVVAEGALFLAIRGEPVSDANRSPGDRTARSREPLRRASRGRRSAARFSGSSKRRSVQPLLVALVAVGDHRRRHLLAHSACPSTRIPMSRRRRRDDDAVAGACGGRSRTTDHRAARDGAQRTSLSRRHALGVALRALEHSTSRSPKAPTSISRDSRCSSDSRERRLPDGVASGRWKRHSRRRASCIDT